MNDYLIVNAYISRVVEGYGRIGYFYLLLLIMVGVITFILFCFRWPEQEELYEQTKCADCKYKYPGIDTFIIDCSFYEKAVPFQRFYSACPHEQDIDDDMKITNTESPRVVNNPKYRICIDPWDRFLEINYDEWFDI